MALNTLLSADVPLRNYTLTHSPSALQATRGLLHRLKTVYKRLKIGPTL